MSGSGDADEETNNDEPSTSRKHQAIIMIEDSEGTRLRKIKPEEDCQSPELNGPAGIDLPSEENLSDSYTLRQAQDDAIEQRKLSQVSRGLMLSKATA